MADSMAIPRLISEAKSQKSLEIVTDDSILTSVFWVGLYLKVRFLLGIWTIWGAYGSRGSLGVWLAAEEAKKSWNQKILLAKSASIQLRTSPPKFCKVMFGKIYGNPTTHLGGEIPKIVRNLDG